MKKATPILLTMLGMVVLGCGGTRLAGPGEFCNDDHDCRSDLVCRQNTCIVPGSNDCDPPCKENEVCRDKKCEPVNPSADEDNDGFIQSQDCDDLNATVHPGAYEYCDGRDNDCDNSSDEDCPACEDGSTQPCGTDLGECTVGIQTCIGGSWGSCSGQGSQPEKADNLDNDCDGSTDEGLPCSAGQSRACGQDLGECRAGSQSCDENGLWGLCQGLMPAAETCDGRDNDCDGQTDNGFMVGQPCPGQGECGPGVWECAGATSIRCSTLAGGSQDQSQAELCNGRDDDCDDQTDEDYGVGQNCQGTGMCGNGVLECKDERTSICSSNPGGSQDRSQPEICDGLDNDCDGANDEDFRVGEACMAEGVCGQGVIECAATDATRCSTAPGGSQDHSSREVCDALDNDCDGQTDEDGDVDLCSPLPPHVVGASCDRQQGSCLISDPAVQCELGWWDFNGDYADGCEMSDDGVGGSCQQAISLAPVSDGGAGGKVTVSGKLIPAGDQDWYKVTAIDEFDNDENVDGCDNYWVSIRFLSKPEGVVLDVATDACTEVGCRSSDLFEYSTHFRDNIAGLGECPCSTASPVPPGINSCQKKDHEFYVRVYRLAGYPINDGEYTLEISNGVTTP